MPAKPSTINRDLRTLRAALKRARPDYRFPGGAFFSEDETRVRWLRPEEELLVFETMPSPLREIAKLGFEKAIVPRANQPKTKIPGLETLAVERIGEAVQLLRDL